MIPYGRQSINEEDIEALTRVLRSDWLTQGPHVIEFEKALASYCGASYAVTVSNGTAALHAAFIAGGLGPDDEFITSPMTFVATTNAGIFVGAKPVFVDIDENTGNIDASLIEAALTERTKAIVPIDYTGRPADLDEIKTIAKRHGLLVIEDACQALGARYKGKPIGALNDLSTFSFHPVKSITTGEGGAILTDNEDYYAAMKRFITHGVTKQNFKHASRGDWYFEMQDLGYNYRLTDIQSALGLSQLRRLDLFIEKRRHIASYYHEALKDCNTVILPSRDDVDHQSSWHLFVIRLAKNMAANRDEVAKRLREAGIGVQIHHIPVHTHPFYEDLGFSVGMFPKAEAFYESIMSLPIYPDLTKREQDEVIETLRKVLYSF
ncbi:MAG: UDP-4-amino-4,6-dideoxy-N-acetyl-beta-L-altrosamine transaminase [Candidatus Magasanikbacteria bacterium]|nr:UDP-4-amino-4,6-dideoxy-N-acetyl-beta-L-altrosamine transaminase [Candidatus Magasanikbacteria bacterium]